MHSWQLQEAKNKFSEIAATALAHDLQLVTRNTRDFTDTGVDLIDPWQISKT